MPSYLTHHLFAKLLEGDISPEGRTCFLYGTQGADLLFFSRALTVFRWDSLAKYGVALHGSKTRTSIEYLSEYLQNNYNPLVEGYIKGYLCHYALDRAVHPFVYAMIPKLREANGRPNTWCHLKIETNIDVLMLKHLTGLKINEYDCRRIFARDDASERQVALLYSGLLNSQFGKLIYPHEVAECFKQRRIAVRLLYSPKRVKYNMLRVFLSPIRPASTLLQLSHPNIADTTFDYINSFNSSWVNPFTQRICTNSVPEIFEKAASDVRIMWNMLEKNDFSRMEWLDFDGKPVDQVGFHKKHRRRLRFRRSKKRD